MHRSMGVTLAKLVGLAVLVVVSLVAVSPMASVGADGEEAPGAPAAFRSLTAGTNNSCALLLGGTVKCWGHNYWGELGLGDTTPRGDSPGAMGDNLPAVSLGAGRTATAITAGDTHTCALLDNYSVKCWGRNSSGQLGLGDTAPRGDNAGAMGDNLPAVSLGAGRTATAITAGEDHTCALLDNGTVKCWGHNAHGQLGLGDTTPRGGGAGEMGDDLPAVNLGAGRTATAITAGIHYTCALLDNGTVKCWGSNVMGELGLGDTSVRGDDAGEMGDALPAVALGAGRTATAITAGAGHACALLDNHTVKCWGYNAYGQLGLGDTSNRGANAGEMGDDLPAVSLGTGRTATAVTADGSHTCVRLDGGTVKCWGYNGTGELGLGDTSNRGDNAGEMGDALPAVALGAGRTATAVTAGHAYTCARLDNGTVKCWGYNDFGQLGLGDITNRGDNAGEMGDALPAVDLGGSALPSGVSGTVTDAVSAAPVAGAGVIAMRTNDFSIAAGAVTDGSGNYTVSIPPGSYFLYLIDPIGGHAAGFHGPPTTVVVPAGTIVDVDPAVAPTRGAITGTITETGTGTPIAGGFALSLSATTAAFERGAVANGSGTYTLPGLNPGSHHIALIDPAGNHATRFLPNSSDTAGATPIVTTAGGTANGNGALPTQTPVATGANLTGTIFQRGTNAPLRNVFVLALRAADFQLARATTTNGAGQYTLNVAAGPYKLAFIDSTGAHNSEWHNNQTLTNLAAATNVTAPTVTEHPPVGRTPHIGGSPCPTRRSGGREGRRSIRRSSSVTRCRWSSMRTGRSRTWPGPPG